MVMADVRSRQFGPPECVPVGRGSNHNPSLVTRTQLLSALPLQLSAGEPMYMTMGDRPNGHRYGEAAEGSIGAGSDRLRRLTGLGFATALVAAGVPAWFGLTGRPWSAFEVGLLLTGLSASLSSAVMALWWFRARRAAPVEVFRLLIAIALGCWGIGQLWLAGDAIDGVVVYPSTGDLIGVCSAPIGLLGILSLPRRSASSRPGLRLVLDSLAVGTALTFLLLRLVMIWPDTGLDVNRVGTVSFVLADCSVFAAVLLTVVRDPRSRLWPTAIGIFCHLVADLGVIVSAASAHPRVDPWFSMSLWCLAWPLVATGVVRYRPGSSAAAGESRRDRREATALLVATLVILPALTIGFLLGGFTDTGGVSRGNLLVALVLVPLMLVRELMDTHLRTRLTAGLRAQALRDSLTGLPNRRALISRIDDLERENQASTDTAWAVLTLDLDGFKQVNDVLGHHAGDALLVAAADALQENCPSEALIARIGGDEFAVLCCGDLTQGRELAERLRAAIAQALARLAPGVGISASVGVGRLVQRAAADPTGRPDPVPGADHRDQLTGLVESAAALRAAKESGRDAVAVYDGTVAQARDRRLLLEQRLRLAITNGDVITFGQPIVDLASERLTGFESLARWTDDELGFVPPDEFIAVAEQTGMVVALGEYLLAETLAAASAAGVFAAGLTLSVNASPIQLRVPGFVDLIRQEMARHRINPEQLIIEITEAILVTEGDLAVSALAEINALGIGLAIDDFGTGYSALGYLRRLPVQVIKIDKSLTSNLLSEDKTLAIVEGVARMAHRMGVRVVMEGIETEQEADACRDVGADRGQGYLFGRPTPWPQAAELIVEMAARPDRRDLRTNPTRSAASDRRPS